MRAPVSVEASTTPTQPGAPQLLVSPLAVGSRWRLRLFRPLYSRPLMSKNELNTNLHIRELKDYYVPAGLLLPYLAPSKRADELLFRYVLRVSAPCMLGFDSGFSSFLFSHKYPYLEILSVIHKFIIFFLYFNLVIPFGAFLISTFLGLFSCKLTVSNQNLHVSLRVFDCGKEIAHVRGRGVALLPALFLQIDSVSLALLAASPDLPFSTTTAAPSKGKSSSPTRPPCMPHFSSQYTILRLFMNIG